MELQTRYAGIEHKHICMHERNRIKWDPWEQYKQIIQKTVLCTASNGDANIASSNLKSHTSDAVVHRLERSSSAIYRYLFII